MANRYYPIGDKELASVTTITGLADKSDALIPWAVNCAVDYVLKNAHPSTNYRNDNTRETLEKARTEWRTVRDEAGDIGTQVHDALEFYLLAKMDNVDTETPIAHMPEQAQKLFKSAVQKLNELGPYTVLATEQKVVNEGEWYAGRFDALLEVDGETWLIDFKTGGAFYPEWGMQLAAYAEGYEGGECQECYGSGGFGGADIISDPFDECLICNGTGVARGKRIDRIKVLRLDKKTLKAHWKEYGGEKDTLTRELYYKAFLGLRDASYVLKVKKKVREAWIAR